MSKNKPLKKRRTLLGLIKTTNKVIRDDGILMFTIKVLQKFDAKRARFSRKKHPIKLMVRHEDILNADPRKPLKPKQPEKKSRYELAWIMSPPGKGSGGHQNIFRFIKFLELAGHSCKIYIYSTSDGRPISEIRSKMGSDYPKIKAPMTRLPKNYSLGDCDGIFATGWETAYPAYNILSSAQRFYFVQDFEPYFFPIGSEHVLAENTYRFGFFGVTAGGWLSKKLAQEYGMRTDHFNFGADPSLYQLTNTSKRKEIFFYARPVTTRRGFEMGIIALELFHKMHPEYKINLAGWDTGNYKIPFPYKNWKTLELNKLGPIYNKCSAALVISLTNMSLLPLELLSCGTIPVVNQGDNNRLVSDNPFIAYTDNNPVALAEKLSEVISMENLQKYSKKAAMSVRTDRWETSGKKFVEIIEKVLGNG